ncbi:hypothetical protein K502DRAFT_348766 [Neoconidiobolus thromboides FSU 785]|nr:hypothetical protein K502DRAFT_348766 [Neoconidiobolus thromboides FSU 785]
MEEINNSNNLVKDTNGTKGIKLRILSKIKPCETPKEILKEAITVIEEYYEQEETPKMIYNTYKNKNCEISRGSLYIKVNSLNNDGVTKFQMVININLNTNRPNDNDNENKKGNKSINSTVNIDKIIVNTTMKENEAMNNIINVRIFKISNDKRKVRVKETAKVYSKYDNECYQKVISEELLNFIQGLNPFDLATSLKLRVEMIELRQITAKIYNEQAASNPRSSHYVIHKKMYYKFSSIVDASTQVKYTRTSYHLYRLHRTSRELVYFEPVILSMARLNKLSEETFNELLLYARKQLKRRTIVFEFKGYKYISSSVKG